MFDLTGKTALVTGASGGIGGAIARGLHAQGAHVVLSGTREEARLKTLQGELGERTSVVVANLSNAEEVDGLVAKAEAEAGELHILVANAGVTKDGLLLRYEGRRLRKRPEDQPRKLFPPHPRGVEGHVQASKRANHRHHLGGRRHRQSGPGQLCGVQGRHDWLLQIARRRSGIARRDGELRRAGFHRQSHDRCG